MEKLNSVVELTRNYSTKKIFDIINTKLTAKEAFNNYAMDALENNDMVPLYVHYFTP